MIFRKRESESRYHDFGVKVEIYIDDRQCKLEFWFKDAIGLKMFHLTLCGVRCAVRH